MNILLTGGSSFTGAALARALASGGHTVRVLYRGQGAPPRLAGYRPRGGGMIRVYPGDVRDPGAMARAMYGRLNAVVHMAYAPARTAGNREILHTAAAGMLNVLRGMEIHGQRALVLVSSPRALDPARDPYGAGKLLQEQMARAWQEDGALDAALVVRPYSVYGPGAESGVIRDIITRAVAADARYPLGEPARLALDGSGWSVRSFCYVDDMAAQLAHLVTAMPHGFHACDAGAADERTVESAVAEAGRALGRALNPDWPPGAGSTVLTPHPAPELLALCQTGFSEGIRATVRAHLSVRKDKTDVIPSL